MDLWGEMIGEREGDVGKEWMCVCVCVAYHFPNATAPLANGGKDQLLPSRDALSVFASEEDEKCFLRI